LKTFIMFERYLIYGSKIITTSGHIQHWVDKALCKPWKRKNPYGGMPP